MAVQTALLGSIGPDEGATLQAAFAAVSTTASTTCFLFNYLVDGVCAKIGQSVGAGEARVLRQRVRLALICAVCAGVIGFALVAGLQIPITVLLKLSPEVSLLCHGQAPPKLYTCSKKHGILVLTC